MSGNKSKPDQKTEAQKTEAPKQDQRPHNEQVAAAVAQKQQDAAAALNQGKVNTSTEQGPAMADAASMEQRGDERVGRPDRQPPSAIQPSRFALRQRGLNPDENALLVQIHAKAVELERLVDQVKGGRYRSIAITHLETAMLMVEKEMHAP